MDTTKIEYLICRGLKRFLFVSCRFPAFNEEYIKRKIDKPTTSKEDLACYLSSCTSAGRKRALFLVIVYIIYCLKNAYIPYQSFSTLDYDNLESNIKTHSGNPSDQSFDSKNSTSLKSFACLWTNCSRLSAQKSYDTPRMVDYSTNHHINLTNESRPTTLSDLAHDVIVLPLFALCSPVAEVLYTPVVKLDSVGVLISAAACLNVFLLGSYTTIQQFIAPAPNDMIMFICAPTVTTQIARSRAGQLFFDLIASFHNLRFKPVLKRKRANSIGYIQIQRRQPSTHESYPASLALSSRPLSDSTTLDYSESDYTNVGNDHLLRQKNSPQSLKIRSLIGQADAIRHSKQMFESELGSPTEATRYTMKRNNLIFEGKTSEEIGEITDSCLPIIRTEWYRAYSARIFNHTLLLAMSLIGIIGLGAFSFIGYRAHIKSYELRLVAHEIKQQNCSLWRAPPASDIGDLAMTIQSLTEIGEVVELDQVEFGWTALAMLLGFVNLIPGFTVAVLFAYYLAALSELDIWLAELRMFLVATLVVSKFKISHAHNTLGLPDDAFVIASGSRRTSHNNQQQPPSLAHHLAFGQLPRSSDTICEPLRGPGQWQQVMIHNSGNESEGRGAIDAGWWSPSGLITDHFYRMKSLRERFQRECWFINLKFLSRVEKDNGDHETGYMNSKRIDQHHFSQFSDKLFFHHTNIDHNQDEKTPSKRAVSLCSQAMLLHRDDFTSELECMEQIYINFRLFVEHVLSLSPSVKVVVAITYLLNYGLVLIAIMCSRKMATLKAEPICIVVCGWVISNYLILLAANFHADAKKLQPLLWSIIAQLTYSNNLRVQHMRYLWTKQVQMLDDSGGLALSAIRLRVTYVNIIQLALGTATIIVISIRSN